VNALNKWLPIATVIFFAGSQTAFAGSAAALLDKTQGSVNDQFYVTLTITGKLKTNIEPPVIEGCGNDCEVAQAGVSHNMQWINGEFSSEDQYTFVIQPHKGGNFTVPSWKLKVDGEEISTLPLKFNVTGSGAGSGSGTGSPNQPGQPTQPGLQQQQQQQPDASGDEIYIEREVPDRSPYVGEAFVSTIRVFHKIKITAAAPKRESAPEFRMLTVPGDKTYQRVINNVRYQVIEFKEALIPLRAGTHTLPPYKLQATVMRTLQKMPGGSVFDFFSNQFFGGPGGLGGMFGREENVEVRGKPTKVTVRELPASGRPEGFAGLVGQFSLRADTLVREVAPGDSITVAIGVEGLGALDTLDQVANRLKEAGKVYPDKPILKEEFVNEADGTTLLRSRKEFKMAVVPSVNSGKLELGQVSVPYFDTSKDSYQVLVGDFGAVDIKAGVVAAGVQGPANDDASGKAAGSDRGSDKASLPEGARERLPSGLITLLLAAAGSGVAALLWRRRQHGRRSAPEAELDVALLESDETLPEVATQDPEKFMDAARRQAGAGMIQEALISIEHGLREVIASRAGRRVDALTPREIRGLKMESVEGLEALALLDQVEALIFSERMVTKDEVMQLIERVRNDARGGS